LYFFLGRSDKAKALPFQKWLAGEVLPAIRKTGRYESAPITNGETVTRSLESLDALRFQRAITMAIENGQAIIGQFPEMTPAAKQAVVIDLVNDAAGRQVITRQASEFIDAYQASLAVEKMSDKEIRQAFGHDWRACSGVLSRFAFDATQAALKAEELSDRVLVACRRAA
jgi:prophage antirepressor-like protein